MARSGSDSLLHVSSRLKLKERMESARFVKDQSIDDYDVLCLIEHAHYRLHKDCRERLRIHCCAKTGQVDASTESSKR